jgi:cobyric acid synthase CobQ/L-threonine-O-3-phosphate decarboxylase
MGVAELTHGGNLRLLAHRTGKPEKEVLDFSANLNPLGPPEWLRSLISSRISELIHYPDPDCRRFLEAAANHYGVNSDEIIVGNGSSEILYLIPRCFGKSCVVPVPSYTDYERACAVSAKPIITFPLEEAKGFLLDLEALESALRGDELIFIGQPNNPTGTICEPEAIRALAGKRPSTLFIIDEAFADFVEGLDRFVQNRPSNVLVLLSLTKSFAIPGLRLGCAIADPAIINRLRALQPPWSVNSLAQAVGAAALGDVEYLVRTRDYVDRQRKLLAQEIHRIGGFTVFPGRANFLLIRIDRPGMDAPTLARQLLEHGIAIRTCDDFAGLGSRFFRIAVRTEEENSQLCEHLSRRKSGRKKRKKPAIMFQGTSSNAGKSVLTAALCRIMLQDGCRVAPFKSQNMSLNSFVTRDGGEMGRAQVVQAQACHIEPDVRMNPLLLKPSSDVGCQVIVCGKPVGLMSVEEYIRFKPDAFHAVQSSYDTLSEEYEAIVLEGAGSPAEVNLKSHDIVNMNMARYAQAPVLLVGDIDRGGVFASFVGTMEVLEEWERALVAGFVVNRFRGRESLLKDALECTTRHTGKRVYGVVPYLSQLGLPEEDSVTFKSSSAIKAAISSEGVEIAVIDLPHISNFTDFDALRNEPDVNIRIVRSVQDLVSPDAIILPGSKSVLEDLACLRQCGLDRAILQQAQSAEIVGICGGYQMLGKKIEDPDTIESTHKGLPGLGLLELATTMAAEKTLMRVNAMHHTGLRLCGYEIHHGRSIGSNLQPIVVRSDGAVIGAGTDRVWGTYLHGVFDADEFRRWFIDRLRRRRGLEPLGKICAPYDLEPALDRLADAVRKSIRMDEIYRLMGLR